MQFKEFVTESKNILANLNNSSKAFFVLGNTSADLDSVVSALVLGFLLQFLAKSSKNVFYIPIINTSREVLDSKLDVIELLKTEGLTSEDLIFYSDVENNTYFANSGIFLVDHNLLDSNQKHIKQRVMGIIDHHKDEKNFDPKNLEVHIIKSSASALTHILHEYSEAVNKSKLKTHSKFLLSALYADSNLFALKEYNKRYYDIDLEVREKIRSKDPEQAADDESFFSKIINLRLMSGTLGSMPLDKLIVGDFKDYEKANVKYGMSSVFGSLDDWMNEKIPQTIFNNFCIKKGLVLYFLLIFNTKTSERYLVAFNCGYTKFDTLLQSLESKNPAFPCQLENNENVPREINFSPSLTKKLKRTDSTTPLLLLKVTDHDASRKVLQPELESII